MYQMLRYCDNDHIYLMLREVLRNFFPLEIEDEQQFDRQNLDVGWTEMEILESCYCCKRWKRTHRMERERQFNVNSTFDILIQVKLVLSSEWGSLE